MGVDIAAYRCRIGTFRHGPGIDVILLRVCVNYIGCLKMIGVVTFIGLLLLMAGIEANPGPLDSPTAEGGEDAIRSVLKQIGLDKYVNNFEDNKIGVNEVGDMTNEDFQIIGVLIGERIRIQKACKQHVNDQLPVDILVPISSQSLAKEVVQESNKATLNVWKDDHVHGELEHSLELNVTVDSNQGEQQETALLRPGGVPTTNNEGSCNIEHNTSSSASQSVSSTSSGTQNTTGSVTEADMSSDTIEEGFDVIDIEQLEKEIREAFKSGGMGRVKTHAEEKLNAWKNTPVKVGVTGRTGTGKSSFINAIRDVEEKDTLWAAVDVTETTKVAEGYPHPDNKNLMLHDLPGAGTHDFPCENYFTDKEVGFDNYDLFIIIASDRFTETDLWLAKEIEKRKKIFLFVRSKVYQDIRNDQEANRSRYRTNPEAATNKVVQKIRQDCKKSLKGIGSETVYLIDSYAKKNPFLDFGLLIDRMVKDLPELLRDAFVFTISAVTPGMIEAKKVALRRRIYKLGLLSALGGAIPIPGLSLAIDVGIVLEETIFYRKQLGLDEESLRKITILTNSSMEILCKVTDLKSAALAYTPKGILTLCGALAASEGVENVVALSLPIIGSLIGGAISYVTTVFSLRKVLDMMVNDAKKVDKFVQMHLKSFCGDEQSVV